MSDVKSLINTGKTAFYTFDIGTLKKRTSYLRNHLPEGVSLCYAVKANTFIIKELIGEVDCFEICSPGEAEICRTLGVPKREMVISGVYKSEETVKMLAADPDFDGIITVESPEQYRMICRYSAEYSRKLTVLLRLTNDSQFGMDSSEIEHIVAEKADGIKIAGIQFFSGTQKTSVKKLKREIDKLDSFLHHLQDDFGYTAEILEYGTGFPVSYFTDDEFDEEEYLSAFSEVLSGMTFKTHITLELGRSIAASCGRYYTHIVDIKHNKGQNYALIDGGMHHLVYFGQHMAMRHPVMSVCGKTEIIPDRYWQICGALCSMNDIVVKQICLPDIEKGDTLCFENTGAYCMTEGISLFLSRDIPAVYLIKENGDAVCVREKYETSSLNTPKYERI